MFASAGANLTPQVAPVYSGVCMLGPLAASPVLQAYDTGDYNNLLKCLCAQCKFHSLKRVLFPANVSMNIDNKYVFAEAGKGTHWVGVLLCLETDGIDLHDWVRLTDSWYEDLLPSLRAFMVQIHKRCGGLCLGQCYGLSSTECFSVIQARVHNHHNQNNVYDCRVFTSYMLFVVSHNDYNHDTDTFDLTSENVSFYRLYLLKNPGLFYVSNPTILDCQPHRNLSRHGNTILSNILTVPVVTWSGQSDCPILIASLEQHKPFIIQGALFHDEDEETFLEACRKCATQESNKYTSAHCAKLPLTISETFTSSRLDNTNRIEHR